MRQIQAAYRCIQSEMKLGPQDWPTVVGMIQSVLNEAPLKRLGSKGNGTHRSPLEVMTGIEPNRKTFSNMRIGTKRFKEKSLTKARLMQVLEINVLQEAFDKMHKTTAEKVKKNRERKIQDHNKKTNIVSHRFNIGDFVLIRRPQDKGHKLSCRWIGPRRITKVLGDLVYETENMVTGKHETVHAARIISYRASAEGWSISKQVKLNMKLWMNLSASQNLKEYTMFIQNGLAYQIRKIGRIRSYRSCMRTCQIGLLNLY